MKKFIKIIIYSSIYSVIQNGTHTRWNCSQEGTGEFIHTFCYHHFFCQGFLHFNFDFLLPLLLMCLDFETLPNLSPFRPSTLRKSLLFSSLPLKPAWDSVSLLLSALSEFRSIMPLTACPKPETVRSWMLKEIFVCIPPWKWWRIWRKVSQHLWISCFSCLKRDWIVY